MVLTTPEAIIEQASTVNLLDDLIDESVRTSPRRPIMMQFDPSSGWIWRRWKGTVFSETWKSCVKNMVYASIIFVLFRTYPVVKGYLEGFGTLWGQLLSVTTFTLTFFVNQSYALWRKCTALSRRLQGRLHDIGMNLATHATRKVPSNPDEASTYTAASRQILELMSRYIRLFNLLTYASFTRSHRPVLTPRGMRRLVERGLMTVQEREVLSDAGIPATQRHSAILMWMIRLFVEGRAAGHIQGGDGFEQQTMEKFHVIRAQYGAIGDELQGRMPLAYAHIVQILVDLILWMYPVMAFSINMSPIVAIAGTGLLTISYQGLFDLAKQFLDPYDNENYGKGEDPLSVDTLIAETNAGSVRWMYGFEEMPFSQQRLKDGELYDYLLPVRGYSVEELAQMEEERIQREKELEEERIQREKELEEQRIREEEERLQREAEEAEKEAEEELTEALEEGEPVLEFNATETEMNVTAESINGQTLSQEEEVEGTAEEEEEVIEVDDRPVHKVTTLADGRVVSLKEGDTFVDKVRGEATAKKDVEEEEDEEAASPDEVTTDPVEITADLKPSAPAPAIPEGVAPYLDSLSRENGIRRPMREEDFIPDLIDYESFKELPWFDDVGPDGQEVRLSQMLADEEFEEEEEFVSTEMTQEEYEQRVAEIEETAQSEFLETVEILNAGPGQDFEETKYLVKEKRRKEKKESPTYDQTRMDGISQLWGLPPEDPDSINELQQPESLDDKNFGSIEQLWGGGGASSDTEAQEESELVGMMGYSGISELWGGPIDDVPRSPPSSKGAGVNGDSDEEDNDSENQLDEDDAPPMASFGGMPWHDEIGPDGKEFRLSQFLADEEWEGEVPPVEMAPLTYEDYTEQVEKIMEAAKEEMLETEAILMARPGADPLGWDYDEELLAPTTEGDNDESEETKAGEVEVEGLEVLEMDMTKEEIAAAEAEALKAESLEAEEESAEEETSIDVETEVTDAIAEEEAVNGTTDPSEPTNEEDAEVNGDSPADTDLIPDDIDEEEPSTVEAALDDASARGTDIIEPIFIESPEETEDMDDTDVDNDDDVDEE